jgi:CCR4-NOT transcriptional regulation complex NOT5 subunit
MALERARIEMLVNTLIDTVEKNSAWEATSPVSWLVVSEASTLVPSVLKLALLRAPTCVDVSDVNLPLLSVTKRSVLNEPTWDEVSEASCELLSDLNTVVLNPARRDVDSAAMSAPSID